MNTGKADLHMHSVYSDGRLTPVQLVDKALESDIGIISITDHDSVAGIEEAVEYGRSKGIQVVSGMEISAEIDDVEIHILGYFIDHKSEALLNRLQSFRELRIKRGGLMIEKLNQLGSELTLGKVMDLAGKDVSLGRPHIARALSEEGFVGSYNEAFYKYIGDGKPAYIKKPNMSAKEAIETISNAGGLSFVAHPGRYLSEEKITELIGYGLDGIEIIHPSHRVEDIGMLKRTAEMHFLLTSGGSDYHGGAKNDHKNFGAYFVTTAEVNDMKRRLIF